MHASAATVQIHVQCSQFLHTAKQHQLTKEQQMLTAQTVLAIE